MQRLKLQLKGVVILTYKGVAGTVRGITEIILIDAPGVILSKGGINSSSGILVSEVFNISLQVLSSAVDHLLNLCLKVFSPSVSVPKDKLSFVNGL